MPSVIRTATAADVPDILALIRELAEYEKLADACVASEALLRQHLFGPDPVAESLVAEVDGRIAGYAIFFRTFSTFLARPGLYLEDIYVKPQLRRRGLGKGMLLEICRIAQRREYGRVEWAVLKWNSPSIAFYQSLGAVPLEEWRTYRLAGDALDRIGRLNG
jgi:GNAT superfamily N-acetyltransferase